jgi:hypothetical protein
MRLAGVVAEDKPTTALPAGIHDRAVGRRRELLEQSATLGIYGHQDQRDLERAMEAFAEAREAEEVESRGNDSLSRLD